MMLKFYGLYKQAVEGPCEEPKPAFYEVVKGYKWRAWKSLGTMPKVEAMENYVEELKKICAGLGISSSMDGNYGQNSNGNLMDIDWTSDVSFFRYNYGVFQRCFTRDPRIDEQYIVETMSYTQDVANFIDALGPFYEFIDIPALKPKNNNNVKGLEDDSVFIGNGDPKENGMTNGHAEKINGDAGSDLDSGSEAAHTSSQSSSPELVSAGSHCLPVPLSMGQALDEAEEDEEELVVTSAITSENTTTHTLTLSPKVYSDSESDEEYSEPAEISINYLLTEQTTTYHPLANQIVLKQSFANEDAPDTPDNATALPNGTVVCGGGDQSHPGGLQMTPRQMQGTASGFGSSLYTTGDVRKALSSPQSGGLTRGSGSGGGAGGGGGRKGSSSSISEDVNAQLVILLRRLQNDMENVLHRLNSLETLTVTQHHTRCHHCEMGTNNAVTARNERRWWPFPELSPRSTFFLLIWPLLLHGGIKLLLLLRSRRRRQ